MKQLTILVCAVLLLSGAGGLVSTVQAQDGDCSKTPSTHFNLMIVFVLQIDTAANSPYGFTRSRAETAKSLAHY